MSKSASLFFLLCFLPLSCLVEAREYLVGGSVDAWKIPSSESDSLNKWAQSSRFRVGDSLVWKYEGDKDSVLQVTKGAYISCNTTEPIEEYRDGNTKVKLTRSGPYYFISGAEGHCEKGQKLIVVVLSARRITDFVSPAPSPVGVDGPAVAPSSGGMRLNCACFMAAIGVMLGFALM